MQLIDLSVAIDNDVPSDPPPLRPRITYHHHAETVPQIVQFFPGMTGAELPEGQGWAVEHVTLTTHNGTHMDAPWHYHPTSGGVPAATIDQVPLSWCYRPGVKLDFRHLPDGHVVSAAEVAAELERINHDLRPLDIVLVNTAAGAAYGTPHYLDAGCGLGREATLFLTERGVRVVGTDGWSWDAPFSHTARRYAETGDASLVWEGHKAGREIGYFQMEKLCNLEALPPTGFQVICFPVKITGAGAGWTRAVALIGDPPGNPVDVQSTQAESSAA